MIISASRRTDIPRYFGDWLINRFKAGFVDVRNPFNPRQVSRYSLSPDVVDGIVFWTKDPSPMLDRLDFFADYCYYFQFTLTPYGKDIEPGTAYKHEMINTFKALSAKIGAERVNWRYDPILLSGRYTLDYHLRAFSKIASELRGYTDNVTISFLDEYKLGGRSVYESVGAQAFTPELQNLIAGKISEIARENGMTVDTCAEAVELDKYGVSHARCVDGRKFEKLSGHRLSRLKTRYEELAKDPAQRKECRCVESIDIGWPSTCLHGCRYCYATAGEDALKQNLAKYDPANTLLCGELDVQSDRLVDHRGRGDVRDRSFKFTSGGNQILLDI